MRIFVDVGAHYGETLDVALDPRWRFDKIFSLEPARACQQVLSRYRDDRLEVIPLGLSNRTSTATLFDAGSVGASVYGDKVNLQHTTAEQIDLVRASTWLLEHTTPSDDVFIKLNCEGSECDVIEDLLDSHVIGRIRSMYVDFDVRKIPSQAHRQQDVERRLRDEGVHFMTSIPGSLGGNPAVTRWLGVACPPASLAVRDVPALLRHRTRLYQPGYIWRRNMVQAVLPRRVAGRIARRFGLRSRLARLRPPVHR